MASSSKYSFGQKKKSSNFGGKLLRYAFFAAVIGAPAYYRFGTETTVTAKVTALVGKDAAKGIDANRVITTEGSFKNENSWIGLKFNKFASIDIQAQLKVGATYEIKSYGGFFWDPNILKIKEVTPAPADTAKPATPAVAAPVDTVKTVAPADTAVQQAAPATEAAPKPDTAAPKTVDTATVKKAKAGLAL